nr:BREX system P-loop protein BrxC [Neobacillus sp. Marseille-Q6967]
MQIIKNIFDKNKDIYRNIEKVITYGASQEKLLKSEISEYVVTESIEDQFENLLTKMQTAMDNGNGNEVGVWVSGFYGSGKSSFTKYLGLAFDEQVKVDGLPFLQHLQNRLHKAQTKALLNNITKRYPAAVVLLDLASEMLAGATMEDVSTVLYYKVLQWAGYSQNLKVAALERKLKKEGRYQEFLQKIESVLGVEWNTVQNDPLVVDSLIPEIAHEMYPALFKTPVAFTTTTSDIIRFENERVKEMFDIVRETTGKEYIVFIIDEVGQYVGSRQNLILNLDGLAKNFKNIGEGKVWIIGTAQQTLTEDAPNAALNSTELYKLKDRFPIQIALESSDIKEICYRRLLGKSPEGEKIIEGLFDKHGQELRFNTKLQDARYYDSELTKELFVNLYPFLPAHFDILLHLLGALAKSTGGIGLRSAIKVIQDILIEGVEQQLPIAEQPVGWIATTVTLYDALEKDIKRAFPSLYHSVEKVLIRFPESSVHQGVAKTVAILQILSNLPVTAQNVASLMHSGINLPSQRGIVERAVADLISDSIVPFGEHEGNLRFFSEKLNDIEQDRARIPLRSVETSRILNESIREVFSPLPSVRLFDNFSVTSGLKVQTQNKLTNLAGDRDPIQTIIEFSDSGDYETVKTRLVDESRSRNSQSQIFLLGRKSKEIDHYIGEIYRCNEICKDYRNEPDQEIKDYCKAQSNLAAKWTVELQNLVKKSLYRGSLIFRGQVTSVDSLGQDVLSACKKSLIEAATQIFNRYSEAPVRAETALAEKFLRVGSLNAVTSQIDPLGLVQVNKGKPSIRNDHKALISIKDYVEKNGNVEGKRLTEHFTGAPFGWSQDTLRYLVAALLVAGEIKLRVSGREITVNGQNAIESLKTNNTFKTVGVALRGEKPSNEILLRAAERLTKLIGDFVVPLEDEISKAASKYLPQYQSRFASMGEKLKSLELPGADRIQTANDEITGILLTDASDAPQRLGSEKSILFDNLEWAREVNKAFNQGLENTIISIKKHIREIMDLPESGVLRKLKNDLDETIIAVKERLDKYDFYKYTTDLNNFLTNIKVQVRDAAQQISTEQNNRIKDAKLDLKNISEWIELTAEEQSTMLNQVECLQIEATFDIFGLKKFMNQEYVINSMVNELKEKIKRLGQQRHLQRVEAEKERARSEGKEKFTEAFKIPSALTATDQLDDLILRLQELKKQLTYYNKIEISLKIEE